MTRAHSPRTHLASCLIAGLALFASFHVLANTVQITITGTVYANGADQSNTSFGVFGPPGSLAGKSFTLVYTFDDTKGQQTVEKRPDGSIWQSQIMDTGDNSPGTAKLTIGGQTVTFGDGSVAPGATSPASRAWRDVFASVPPSSQTQVYVQDVNTLATRNTNSSTVVQFAAYNMPTTDGNWGGAVSVSPPVPNYLGYFHYSRFVPVDPSKGQWQWAVASGSLQVESVTFSGPTPTSGSTQAILVDPVPTLVKEQRVTTDFVALGAGGREVTGTAADGVTQVVIRYPANFVNERFTLTLLNDQGSQSTNVGADGGLVAVGTDPLTQPGQLVSSLPVQAQNAGSADAATPMMFAIYRAPTDFARTGSQDPAAYSRSVSIRIQSMDTSGYSTVLPVKIVRAPVVLIHGLWSDRTTWNAFAPFSDGSDQRFPRLAVFRADYSVTAPEGIKASAVAVLASLKSFNNTFRQAFAVASVQFDVVAHSMGGLVTRQFGLTPGYLARTPFAAGFVHKLISIDTPHKGSPFANILVKASDVCGPKLGASGSPITQDVRDLATNSDFIKALNSGQASPHVMTHAVDGLANVAQTFAAESFWIPFTSAGHASGVCNTLFPADFTFAGVLGPNSDLIVDANSQQALGLGVTQTVPSSTAPVPVIHTYYPPAFPLGPDVLGKGAGGTSARDIITDHVIDLLNAPVTDATKYAAIRP